MTKHPILTLMLGALAAPLANVSAVDFEKEVWPFLEKKCVDCHRETYEDNGRTKKPKAGLRLDGDWAFYAGSENGKVMKPGDSKESYLYEVVTLPEDDDMFMPPKGDPLTDAERELLKKWIDEGSEFGEWTGNQNGRPEGFELGATDEAAEKIEPPKSPYDELAKGVSAASEDAIKKVEDAGGRVTALAPDHPLVRVDFVSTAESTGDEAVAALEAISGNVAQLDLGRTQVTSASLAHIGKLEKLRTLDLHSTAVGDDGLDKLAGLKNLSYLNLYDTKVTDKGIQKLGGLTNLESLYLWKSEATEAGVKKLRGKLSKTKISYK